MEPTLSHSTDVQQTELPRMGASIPRRGNRLTRAFFTFLMRLFGWRIVGHAPDCRVSSSSARRIRRTATSL